MIHLSSDSQAGRQTPQRVGALCASADGWSLVIASSESGSPRLLMAEALKAGDAEGVRRHLSRHGANTLVRVIPPGEAIVRTVTLPAGDAASAGAAVALMAEAQLPAHVEPHRRTGALLPLTAIDDARVGMLAGWISRQAPERVLPDDSPETWVPSGAALSWLLALGEHSSDAWGVVSTPEGASCVVACSPEGPRVRSGRIGDAGAAARELHQGADLGTGRSVALDAGTVEALRAVAPTSGVDGAWIDRYALCVGAAMCALSGSPLAGVLAEPPRYHYTPVQRAALTLADKRRTRSLIALGLLLIFVAPVALIYARHETLAIKLERAREAVGAEAQAEVDELVRNASFAEALERRAVPCTKILGAVADAMPVGEDLDSPLGVQVESIDITPQGVTIKGEASSSTVAQDFVRALASKAIFASVPPADVKDNDRGGSTFTITATVGRIESPVAITGGFIENPFAVRLHGEEAREYDYASVTNMGQQPSGSSSTSRTGTSGRSRTAGFDASSDTRQETEPVPEVLGADKINEMDFETARAAFTERRRAASRSDIDDTTKEQLAEDVELLRNRLRALRGG
ncbi:MAG: hypothetical protein Tsb0013_00280 [Phycisphaerales bacterium]